MWINSTYTNEIPSISAVSLVLTFLWWLIENTVLLCQDGHTSNFGAELNWTHQRVNSLPGSNYNRHMFLLKLIDWRIIIIIHNMNSKIQVGLDSTLKIVKFITLRWKKSEYLFLLKTSEQVKNDYYNCQNSHYSSFLTINFAPIDTVF